MLLNFREESKLDVNMTGSAIFRGQIQDFSIIWLSIGIHNGLGFAGMRDEG